jgi:hypothetical protein
MNIKVGVVAAIAFALVGFAAPAQALGDDLCSNFPGVQTVEMFEAGLYRYKQRTEDPDDCRYGPNLRPA